MSSNPVPIDALKRFAEEVKQEPHGARYYNINLVRVNDFITKAEKDETSGNSHASKLLESKLADRNRKNGVYGFPPPKEHHRALASLQDIPESSPELGMRSRFGQGSGSFIDRFLISTDASTGTGTGTMAPGNGFRRELAAVRSGQGKPTEIAARIKPYAERRRERLEKEAREKAVVVPVSESRGSELMIHEAPIISKQMTHEAPITSKQRPDAPNSTAAVDRAVQLKISRQLARLENIQGFSQGPEVDLTAREEGDDEESKNSFIDAGCAAGSIRRPVLSDSACENDEIVECSSTLSPPISPSHIDDAGDCAVPGVLREEVAETQQICTVDALDAHLSLPINMVARVEGHTSKMHQSLKKHGKGVRSPE